MMRVHGRQHGFTLVEVIASIVIMSVIAAVVLPVMTTFSRRHAEAATERAAVQRIAHAGDRLARVLRESPTRSDGRLAIDAAETDALRFSDGRGIELDGSDLMLHLPDGRSGLLLSDVETFQIGLLDASGAAAPVDPIEGWRITYELTAEGQTLAGVVFPRALMGRGTP